MKNTIHAIIIVFLPWIIPAQAQDPSAGNHFHKIVISGELLVQIMRADHYSVEVKKMEVNDKCLVNTTQNGVLTLKLAGGSGCRGKVTVNVTCPVLKEIEVSGKAELATGNVLTCDTLSIQMRTGASAYVDMDSKFLHASLSGGAMGSFEGYAVQQSLAVSTSSTFSGWELEGDSVAVNAVSNAIAKVNAQEFIDAVAGSGGYIGIKGNPGHKKIDSKSYGKIEILPE